MPKPHQLFSALVLTALTAAPSLAYAQQAETRQDLKEERSSEASEPRESTIGKGVRNGLRGVAIGGAAMKGVGYGTIRGTGKFFVGLLTSEKKKDGGSGSEDEKRGVGELVKDGYVRAAKGTIGVTRELTGADEEAARTMIGATAGGIVLDAVTITAVGAVPLVGSTAAQLAFPLAAVDLPLGFVCVGKVIVDHRNERRDEVPSANQKLCQDYLRYNQAALGKGKRIGDRVGEKAGRGLRRLVTRPFRRGDKKPGVEPETLELQPQALASNSSKELAPVLQARLESDSAQAHSHSAN